MILSVLFLSSILTFILLFRHFEKNAGIVYLIVILFLFSIREVQLYAHQTLSYAPILAMLNIHVLPITLLTGPCILYFVKSYLKGRFYIDKYFLIHSIPCFLMLINIYQYISIPYDLKLNHFIAEFSHSGSRLDLDNILLVPNTLTALIPFPISFFYIFYAAYYLLREFKRESFHKKYKMLKFLIQFLLLAIVNYVPFLLFIIWLIKQNGTGNLYLMRFPPNLSVQYLYLFSLVLPLSFFLFPDFLFKAEMKFFSNLSYFDKVVLGEYYSELNTISNLNQAVNDYERIEKYIVSQKPYLELDFSVQTISQELQIPRNRISEAFSIKLNKSFPHYRNQLRILHSIELLKEDFHKNYSIEGIAVKSGFKSKSTFYAAFKSETGQTPIDWIKENM
jgi:AraC-like DNA-binding protein